MMSRDRPRQIEAIYPLSPMQQGMLFHTIYAPQSGVYFHQLRCTLDGELDNSALARAWQRVVDRHPILRTAFTWQHHKKPLQVVRQQVALPWEHKDLRGLGALEQEEQLQAYLKGDREKGFVLSKPPLMRCALIQIGENLYEFVWSYHHILLDGWSIGLLLNEVMAYYEAFRRNQELYLPQPRPYQDYIAWLKEQDMTQAETFWRRILGGFNAPTPLVAPLASSGSETLITDYDELQIELSQQTTAAQQSLSRRYQLTLNTLVQGAWALLLSRYSGERDVVFGAVVSGRPVSLPGIENMVGLFVNTLSVRTQVTDGEALLTWLKKMQSQQAELRQYEFSPLVQVQGWSDVPRGLPLFESIYGFENYPVETFSAPQEGSLQVHSVRSIERTNYPLNLMVWQNSTLLLKLFYDCRRFDPATIRRMLGHLRTLLDNMASNPNRRLSELNLLDSAERELLLVEWNRTEAEFPAGLCIQQWFEAQVERTPDAVALSCEGEQMSFRSLNESANQLAHRLQRLGVRPESLVGICMERGLEMVVGLLGILKAGGAYVPLDPAYPRARLWLMLGDAGARVLVTQEGLKDLVAGYDGQTVCVDRERETISGESTANCVSGVVADNLAYVIYTSGSTGRPKGVMVAHKGVSNTLRWRQVAFSLSPQDCMLQTISIAFDPSVWQIFGALVTGSRLILARAERDRDPSYLLKLISEQEITIADFVPSMLQAFLDERPQVACQNLRHVFCGGEVLPVELQERFFKTVPASLHNMYGPTEATIDATCWTCEPREGQHTVPIGRPVANKQVYVLDLHLQAVPIAAPGHLHVGGIGLTRGYLNHPELTAERLIPNPFSREPGTRLYQTGDLARYLPDGRLEFLGRLDQQVKMRGFRIELEEIESALNGHPAVQATVVVARDRGDGDKQLVAYVVADKVQTPTVSELRSYLKQKLPEYMIPASVVLLDELPLTPNGKIDRLALPAPSGVHLQPETVYLAPRNEVEEIIAGIWQETLQLDRVGVNDNFFDLGMHSLLLLRANGKLRAIFNQDLSIVEMFRYPTISLLAERLSAEPREQQSLEESQERAALSRTATRRRRELRKSQTAAFKR